jgi:hypothetical protein
MIPQEVVMDRPTAEPVEPPAGSLLRAPLQLWLVALLMSVSFGAGFLLQPSGAPATPPPAQLVPAQAPAQPPARMPVAPPLSDDQLEEAELPAGHPPLSPSDDADTSSPAGSEP